MWSRSPERPREMAQRGPERWPRGAQRGPEGPEGPEGPPDAQMRCLAASYLVNLNILVLFN